MLSARFLSLLAFSWIKSLAHNETIQAYLFPSGLSCFQQPQAFPLQLWLLQERQMNPWVLSLNLINTRQNQLLTSIHKSLHYNNVIFRTGDNDSLIRRCFSSITAFCRLCFFHIRCFIHVLVSWQSWIVNLSRLLHLVLFVNVSVKFLYKFVVNFTSASVFIML